MFGGVPEPLYVAARHILLDALEAVVEHLDAVVVVGAQAIYLRTGEGDPATAPYTTDADLAINPARLGPKPLIEVALAQAGFVRDPRQVGIWTKAMVVAGTHQIVPVDFLVPESLGGPGRCSARMPPHEQGAARKVVGPEGALVDNEPMLITALDGADARGIRVAVAGPAALFVAKTHKIIERLDRPDRRADKDALDVLRLLRAVPIRDLSRRLKVLLVDPAASSVTRHAVKEGVRVFGSPAAVGSQMAARAAAGAEPRAVVAASLAALMTELSTAVESEERCAHLLGNSGNVRVRVGPTSALRR